VSPRARLEDMEDIQYIKIYKCVTANMNKIAIMNNSQLLQYVNLPNLIVNVINLVTIITFTDKYK
jgi:hypothetical protein